MVIFYSKIFVGDSVKSQQVLILYSYAHKGRETEVSLPGYTRISSVSHCNITVLILFIEQRSVTPQSHLFMYMYQIIVLETGRLQAICYTGEMG